MPISATTKSKLQNFQCQDTSTEQSDPDTKFARNSEHKDGAGVFGKPHDHGDVDSKDQPARAKSDPAGKMSPDDRRASNLKTPVSRLAWQDLMGVADPDKQDVEISPNERLLWHNEHDDIAASISPLVPRRGKKRARSSSPVSSPLRTPAVNVKKLAKALRTPRADPALDLWDRFAVGGPESKSPLGATNPALAHLMASSSPRPQKNGTGVHAENSLRRAMSCGSHWPKRRRVESASELGPAHEQEDTTKSSMVTALLETVNGEIKKTEEPEEDTPEVASPSVKKRRSPRKLMFPSKSVLSPPLAQSKDLGVATVKTARSPKKQDAGTPTSDYGDDDFDDDTLLELDASLLSGQVGERSFSAAAETLVSSTVEGSDRQVAKQDASNDDEFDDMDDEMLAAAEDIVAQVAPKDNTHTPAPNAVRPDGGTEDDDLYGDDDFGGDFDFEAAELAATQTIGEIPSSLMRVRTIR